MTFILTEKPSVAKAFAHALAVPFTGSYYENNRYLITNCLGHLFQAFDPEDYEVHYKKWSLSDLPIIPHTIRFKKIEASKKQANLVVSLLQTHQSDTIIIATDAGREGELIARIVLSEAGITDTKNIFRFWTSSALTPPVITEALKKVKPLSDYNDIARQGYARQKADWLVGINISRLLSLHAKTLLSVGRVQTAVLAEISRREKEIADFIPTPYYEYVAKIASSEAIFTAKAYTKNEDASITTAFQNDCFTPDRFSKKPVAVQEIKQEQKKEVPPLLFNLSALQRAAFSSLSLSPDQTLAIAQTLYEKYQCLSYPRTPSRVMGSADVPLIKDVFERISAVYPEYTGAVDTALLEARNARLFNDAQLEDHHALIPLQAIPDAASKSEKAVFSLVVKQFFASFSHLFVYEMQTLFLTIDGVPFIARGRKTLQSGWKSLFSKEGENSDETGVPDKSEENTFDDIDTTHLLCKEVRTEKKKTQSKKPYRYDSLLQFMEKPKENGKHSASLGTEATRAAIIQTLLDRAYIHEEKKNLHLLEKGIFLIQQLEKFPLLSPLISAQETAEWEYALKTDSKTFLEKIEAFVSNVCKEQISIAVFEKQKIGICPLCGGAVVEMEKAFSCNQYSVTGCRFTIWKKTYGTLLSASDAALLLNGKSVRKKNCKSKAGKVFSCILSLVNGTITLSFDTSKERKIRR